MTHPLALLEPVALLLASTPGPEDPGDFTSADLRSSSVGTQGLLLRPRRQAENGRAQ